MLHHSLGIVTEGSSISDYQMKTCGATKTFRFFFVIYRCFCFGQSILSTP